MNLRSHSLDKLNHYDRRIRSYYAFLRLKGASGVKICCGKKQQRIFAVSRIAECCSGCLHRRHTSRILGLRSRSTVVKPVTSGQVNVRSPSPSRTEMAAEKKVENEVVRAHGPAQPPPPPPPPQRPLRSLPALARLLCPALALVSRDATHPAATRAPSTSWKTGAFASGRRKSRTISGKIGGGGW
jgi:hypothetical protein